MRGISPFLETIAQLRPRLHRYCSRMTGSVMDGEDVVQDALFEAYRKLDQYDDSRPLVPWLFRIAHNRCIDFLRRRGVRTEAEATSIEPDYIAPANPAVLGIGRAVERLVMSLPPKERACVLLWLTPSAVQLSVGEWVHTSAHSGSQSPYTMRRTATQPNEPNACDIVSIKATIDN